jgi:hypothetical protein
VHGGILACGENQWRLAAVLPGELAGILPAPGRLRPASSFLGRYQYTRGQAEKSAPEIRPTDAADIEASADMMIFGGETVIAGSLFVHGFQLRHASLLEVGALAWGLDLWRDRRGGMGGMGSKGHGRLAMAARCDPAADLEAAASEYCTYCEGLRDEALAYLERAFARPAREGGDDVDGDPAD